MADETTTTTPAPTTKAPWLSKTLILNLVMAVAAFIPGVGTYIAAHPDIAMSVLAGVNFILRLVTKDKISLQD